MYWEYSILPCAHHSRKEKLDPSNCIFSFSCFCQYLWWLLSDLSYGQNRLTYENIFYFRWNEISTIWSWLICQCHQGHIYHFSITFRETLLRCHSKTLYLDPNNFPLMQSSDYQQSRAKSGLCRVCGDKANIINYGALSCASCKTFFRRNGFYPQVCRRWSTSCRFLFDGSLLDRMCVHVLLVEHVKSTSIPDEVVLLVVLPNVFKLAWLQI